MGLKLIKDNGIVRRAWYWQYKEGGRYKVVRLTTKMHGEKIPSSLTEKGDAAFENSRTAALKEIEDRSAQIKDGKVSHSMKLAMYEAIDEKPLEKIPLCALVEKWRMHSLEERGSVYDDKVIGWIFRLFTDYVKRDYVREVTEEDVLNFYKHIRPLYAKSTVERIMRKIKKAFEYALPVGAISPCSRLRFSGDKDAAPIHRRPLSDAELNKLFEEAKKTPLLYSLVIATAYTGLRIGDVCNLKWDDVKFKKGVITMTTRKTGAGVTIPILEPMREVLEQAQAKSDARDEFVFPEAAQLYTGNYSKLIRMGKILFARALFTEEAKREANITDAITIARTPAEILDIIRNARWSESKREKIERVYTLYAAGQTYREIARETGFSRGQISMYLHEVEDAAGVSIVKWSTRCATSAEALMRRTRQERKVGRHSASLYGWHSLRATFVVKAHHAGLDLELVRKIVGHTTTEMTREYFNPTEDIIAEEMKRKMSRMSISPPNVPVIEHKSAQPITQSSDDEIAILAAKLAKLTPAEREQLKALLGK